jgi:hypothetical protein
MSILNKEIFSFKKTDSPSGDKKSSVWGRRIWRFLVVGFIFGVIMMILEMVYLKVIGLL